MVGEKEQGSILVRRYIDGITVDYAAKILEEKLRYATYRFDEKGRPVPSDRVKVKYDEKGNVLMRKALLHKYRIKATDEGISISLSLSKIVLLIFFILAVIVTIVESPALICLPVLLPITLILGSILLYAAYRVEFSNRLDLIADEIAEKKTYGWPGAPPAGPKKKKKKKKPATLMVVRESRFLDLTTFNYLFVDRKFIGRITKGHAIEIPISSGWHSIQIRKNAKVKGVAGTSWEIDFFADPGEHIEFQFYKKPAGIYLLYLWGYPLDAYDAIWIKRVK